MTRSPSAALTGARKPRLRSVPEYHHSDGWAAIELAEIAGLTLDPWEADALIDAMATRPGDQADRWAALEVLLLVARQNGKGTILEVRELAGLFLPWLNERLILHSAHEFKTAREAFIRVSGLVDGSDELRRRVKRIRTSHGEEGIELLDGRRLQFVARSTSSGRGFTGDVIILDEAFALTDEMLGAMFPTISARTVRGNPQVWYTSSAGSIVSTSLLRVRQRGVDRAPRMCFLEWSAEEAADSDDRRAWAQANPGLGIRISGEAIEAERGILSDEAFRRERLGIWPRTAENRDIPESLWDAVCSVEAKARKSNVRLGVDVAPDQSSAAVAAWDGRVGELVDHRPGIAWLVDRIAELVKRHQSQVVIDGNGPAVFLEPVLQKRGIRLVRLSNAEVYASCARIFSVIADRRLSVRAAMGFDEAVSVVTKKRVAGDRFVWRREVGDVTPFFALTLAFGPIEQAVSEPLIAFV